MAELKTGSNAPSFSLEDESGKKVSLKDFKGKTVVLFFYPKDLTSGCTQEACDFRDLHTKFKKKNVVVLGVSKDSALSHEKFIAKYELPFSLPVDDQTKVAAQYGVWKEKSMYGRKYMGVVRTTFVISPSGKIQKIYEKVKVKDHAQTVLDELDT